MTLRKRYFAMVLCLCLLAVSLFGCVSGGGESSVAESSAISESSEVSEVSTEPQKIDGKEPYEKAVKAFKELKDFTVEYKYSISRECDTFRTTEECEGKEEFISAGTNDMFSRIEAVVVHNGEREVKTKRVYAYGKEFLDYDGYHFYSHTKPDAFMEDDTVLHFFDVENYDDIYMYNEASEDGSRTIYFDNAKRIETWASSEKDKLINVEASAVIDADGNFSKMLYSVKYDNGAAIVDHSLELTVVAMGEEKPDITVPEDESKYEKVDNVDLIPIYDEVLMNFKNINIFEMERTRTILSNAIGYLEYHNTQISSFNHGSDYALSLSGSELIQKYNPEDGKTYSSGLEEKYLLIGNKMTRYTDEGEETIEVGDEEINALKRNEAKSREYLMPEITDIDNIQIFDLNGYHTLYINGNSAYDDTVRDIIYRAANTDLSLADQYASKYECRINKCFVTIDSDTLLPIAVTSDYEGAHKIGEQEAVLSYESITSLVVENSSTYYNIAQEHYEAFDEEPAEDEKAKPLLYKITGENGEELWLFGTVHAGDNRTAHLPEEVYSAFDSADAVAFEVDIIEFAQKVSEDPEFAKKYSESLIYRDGTLAYHHIDEELYDDAYDYAYTLGMVSRSYYSAIFLSMKPYALASLMTDKYLNHSQKYSMEKGVDIRLLLRAKENEKKIYNVEKFEREIDFANSTSDMLNQAVLREAITTDREDYVEDFKKLYRIWLNGDIEAYREYMKEAQDTEGYTEEELKALEEYTKALMQDRDAQMLEKLKGYLESGETVFAAVGLAHLLNEDTGLVETLAEAGYTVELVEYK